MVLANLDQASEELEKQEMQVQGGVAPPEVYAKLLAIYLLQNDLCNAKFLWKRIPPGVKAQNAEIGNIWAVGKAMWLRDAPAVYTALNNAKWSDDVAPIMASLVVKGVSTNFIHVEDCGSLMSDQSAIVLTISDKIIMKEDMPTLVTQLTDWQAFRENISANINLKVVENSILRRTSPTPALPIRAEGLNGKNIINTTVNQKSIMIMTLGWWVRGGKPLFDQGELVISAEDKVRERCLGLVSQAYTSVTLETLSKLLGVSPSEAATIALTNSWTVEDKLAYPVKPNPQQKQLTSTEQQLHILTNFVSFLEN